MGDSEQTIAEAARRRDGYTIHEVMDRLGGISRAAVHEITYQPLDHKGRQGRRKRRDNPNDMPLRYISDESGNPVKAGKGGWGGARRWDVESVEAERERRQNRCWASLRAVGGPREDQLADLGLVLLRKPRVARRIREEGSARAAVLARLTPERRIQQDETG